MSALLAIVCSALIATAAANGGYNYQQGRPGGQQSFRPQVAGGGSGAGGVASGIYSAQQAPPLPAFRPNFGAQGGSSAQYSQQQLASGPSQLYNPSAAQFNGAPAQYAASYQQQQQQSGYASNFASGSQYSNQNQYNGQYSGGQGQQQTIVSKDIYIHSAPEEVEEVNPDQGPEAPLRKNYRIVFIKAPSQNIRVNSVQRTQASNEEKTVIYVLSKKPDIVNIQNQFTQTEQKASKPEVYFIKYKTQEEANRAQKEIQAQYDALGGSTSVSDEGFAPVTSVIGGGGINGGSAGSGNFGGSGGFGGSAGAGFGGGSINGASFSGGSNFLQPAASNQQSFGQPAFLGNQGSASSSVGVSVDAPSKKYLPAKKK